MNEDKPKLIIIESVGKAAISPENLPKYGSWSRMKVRYDAEANLVECYLDGDKIFYGKITR